MNIKIIYSIGLLLLVGLVFFGIYKQRTIQKSASTQNTALPLQYDQAVLTPTVAPTTTPISTSAGLTLIVTSPTIGQTVTISQITIKGKTAPLAEVFVNDVELKADASGNFSQGVTLEEGENYILVVANDTDGNFAEKELSITYTPAE
ncbi:MAG: hypothetical protein AAB937_01065 [Patescibacteria group bacterium]